MNRRKFLAVAMTATGAACLSRVALADGAANYPARPVKVLVGYVPNGGPDTIARALMPALGEVLGGNFIIENHPGASGTIATLMAVKAKPDGYTLLMGETAQLDIAPFVFRDLPYDPRRDLTPVAMVTGNAGVVLVASAASGISSYEDLIRKAKADPGKISFGSVGIGSRPHIAMEVFEKDAGIKLTHIPYKGAGEQIPALMGGSVQLVTLAYEVAAPYIRNGQMKAIVVLDSRRIPEIRDIPSLTEYFPGYDYASHAGVLGPKGLPVDIRDKLAAGIQKAIQDPQVQRLLNTDGRQLDFKGPDDYAKVIADDYTKFQKAAAIAGIKPQ